jgi:hypothetical protein
VGGEGWVNTVSTVVDPECRLLGFRIARRRNPLTKNQRALPVFWKRPLSLVGRQGLEPWTR